MENIYRLRSAGIKSLIAIILVFCVAPGVYAQSFTASVNQNPVSTSDPFEITFTFSGSDVNGISNFQAPSFGNFSVLSGPNQSTSMQIINGSVSGSRSFSYYLQAKEKGKFTIGSASITNRGNVLKTHPITIEVVQGSARPNAQKGGQQGNEKQVSAAEIGDNVFIRASADKSNAYIGEQVTVVYKLYTRLNIASLQVVKMPSYTGFWAEDITTSQNVSFTQETLNGKQYSVAVLKKVALFPSQSGELTVTPLSLKLPVILQRKKKSQNLFDDFFNDPFFQQTQTVDFNAVSNNLKIRATALPEAKKPAGFNGAVGSFSMSAELDRKTVKQNEPVSLKLTISGSGNIQLLTTPDIQIPAAFEKYDPKINDDIQRTGVISGKKTFEYLLIPRVEGRQELPPVTFSYFDTRKHDYVTLTAHPGAVDVTKGDAEYTGKGSNYSKEEIKLLGEDIRYIKNKAHDIKASGSYMADSSFSWILLFFPFAGIAGVMLWKAREAKLAGNLELLRNRKAEKLARARLKAAQKALLANKVDAFYDEISFALLGYIEYKMNIPRADLSMENITEVLSSANISQERIEGFTKSLEECEFIRFAPTRDKENRMKPLYDNCVSLIVGMEAELSQLKGGRKS
jgi:hypothetical protein